MYNLIVSPENVQSTLQKHVLADGFDLTFDMEKTNRKFIKRFQYLESKAKESGRQLHDMTLAEMDVFWNEAKSLK
jgi:uncharacterized protein YabN with tetrapyrrole methylase and pyrophosphatase domain